MAIAQPPGSQTVVKDAEEQAYHGAIAARAEQILIPLRLEADAHSNRVHAIIMEQYRTLRRIHAWRDQALKEIPSHIAQDSNSYKRAQEQILRQTRVELDLARREFLGRLETELRPEQIDQIKDGMTYRLAEITYRAYLRLLPELTEEQRQHIRAMLYEARELAMDEGSARDKHILFNRYKGRINNYLSSAGYDLQAAERRLRQSMGAGSTNHPSSR
ncbi:MAG: DUF3826 domain-containing protein [Verrucomicrobiota bacterium]|nr:DUF3826 domain-containing protein [Limisphaera sp.]MDW8382242.1 DUF3826 domain-containing protein [Verrucomicrobiota bacterium]